MENEKVYYSISVSKETSIKIRQYAEFLNAKNKYRKTKKPFITEEDVIKAGLNHLFEFFEKFYGFTINEKTEKPQLEIKAKIKNRFREIAHEQGLDQSAVCKLTGINPANISRIFNNGNQPTIDFFFRLWIALDRPPVETIFYATDEK